MDFFTGILNETVFLFIEMTPYILFGVIIAGILSVYVNKKYVAKHIGGHTLPSIFKAALFGVPLPLCSCGVVPTTVYLKQAGASKPAAMSFLISTPQTGVDSIIATYGMLGPFFAVFRPVAALLTGMWGGFLSLVFDHSEERKVKTFELNEIGRDAGFREKFAKFRNYAFVEFVDDIASQFVFGLILAGIISYVIPDNLFSGSFFADGLPGMIFMIIIGIPLYICSTSSIPIAVALIAKGISPGAAYVFLIAGPATNAASLAVLLKVLGKKQTFIYLLSIITGSIMAGFVINIFYANTSLLSFIPGVMEHTGHNSLFKSIILYGASGFFLILLILAFYRKFKLRFQGYGSNHANHSHEHLSSKGAAEVSCSCGSNCSSIIYEDEKQPDKAEGDMNNMEIIGISGMSCHHCAANVENAVKNVEGVTEAKVNLEENFVEVNGKYSRADIEAAVEAVGYKVVS